MTTCNKGYRCSKCHRPYHTPYDETCICGGLIEGIECKHENEASIADFSFYNHMAVKQKHLYCSDCKGHFFKDRWWSLEEWEVYINN